MSILASNIHASVAQRDLDDLFSRYGALESTVKLSPEAWEITFRDVRDAKEAGRNLAGDKLNGLRMHLGPMEGVLFLTRVSPKTTEEDLDALFGRYGKVTVLASSGPGCWKIQYEEIRDADVALKDMHGQKVDGHRILINAPYLAPTGHAELTITGDLRLASGQTIELVPTKISVPIQ